MAEWPQRWQGPQFKGDRVLTKVRRHLQRRQRTAAEDANKRAVRRRDKTCRFPFCGCRKFQIALEVSHVQHKGMGSDPTGERSQPALMMLLCQARHRAHLFSVDQKNVRWEPLTEAGADGPVVWFIRRSMLHRLGLDPRVHLDIGDDPEWAELVRETRVRAYEMPTPEQQVALAALAEMLH